MKMVTLKNGQQMAEPAVTTALFTLQSVLASHGAEPIRELLCLCRDASYQLFGGNGTTLKQAGLLQSWDPATGRATLHSDVEAIVLLAVKEQGGAISIDPDITVAEGK